MASYKPIQSFLIISIVALLGGVMVGILLFASTQIAYLLVVSSMGAGLCGGWLLYLGVHWSHLNHKATIIGCGILMGLVVFWDI